MRGLVLLAVVNFTVFLQAQIIIVDDVGRQITMQKPAQRIVSLAPHLTELVYAAGAGEQLIAVVSYRNFPAGAEKLPQIGSYKLVNYESLVSLKPDLVLTWKSGNGDDIIQRLDELGFNYYVSEPRTMAAVATDIQHIAALTGNDDEGRLASEKYLAELQRLQNTYQKNAPVSVYYQIWKQPLMTLNGEHLISDVIRLCGGRNVFAEAATLVSRISVESALRPAPEVIVASGMGEERPEWLDDWLAWPNLPAVKNQQLYFIPPDWLQRHTPRILLGAQQMGERLQLARQQYGLQ